MTLYSLEACEKLIAKYVDKGGEVVTLREGVLGLGTLLCTGDNLKTTIINEVYLNCWSSGHTIRQYNKCPKKYLKIIKNN